VADAISGNPNAPYKISLSIDAINDLDEMTEITVYPNPTRGSARKGAASFLFL